MLGIKKIDLLSLFLVLMAIAYSACTTQQAQPTISTNHFFSLKNFINQQVEELSLRKTKLKKSVALNEQTEEKILKEVNWADELTLFRDSDINKPAWSDKYRADSIRINGRIQLVYTALEENLKTRQIKVNLNGKDRQPLKFSITNQTSNLIYTTKETLVYEPNKYYLITVQQKVMGQSEKQFIVKGEFVH